MLTQDQRDTIEKLLLRERGEALEMLEQFDENTQDMHSRAGEMSLYRFHPADLGTEMEEKEKEFLFASREGQRLYAVDAALRRLYRDPETFGTCARCGNAIEFERLEVVPATEHCAACQKALEGDAGTEPHPREADGNAEVAGKDVGRDLRAAPRAGAEAPPGPS